MTVEVNDPLDPSSILLWLSKTLPLSEFILVSFLQPTTKRVFVMFDVLPFGDKLRNEKAFSCFLFVSTSLPWSPKCICSGKSYVTFSGVLTIHTLLLFII